MEVGFHFLLFKKFWHALKAYYLDFFSVLCYFLAQMVQGRILDRTLW